MHLPGIVIGGSQTSNMWLKNPSLSTHSPYLSQLSLFLFYSKLFMRTVFITLAANIFWEIHELHNSKLKRVRFIV